MSRSSSSSVLLKTQWRTEIWSNVAQTSSALTHRSTLKKGHIEETSS